MADIKEVGIKISAKVDSDTTKINSLTESLNRLKKSLNFNFDKINEVSNSLNSFSKLNNIKTTSTSINSFSSALTKLKSISFSGFSKKMESLTKGLKPLAYLDYSSVSNYGRGLNTFVSSTKKLNSIDFNLTSKNITKLVDSIKPLTNEMLRGGKVAGNYANIISTISRKSIPLTKNTSNLNKSFFGLRSSFLKISSYIFVVRRITEFLSEMVEQTASWTENLNLFANSMGSGVWEESLEWVNELAEKFGFANNELLKFTGLFKQLSTSLGVADDVGNGLSKTLTQLALDFSSFYNVDLERTMATFQSAIFGGQTKGIRQLFGIEVAYQSLDQTLKDTRYEFSKFGVSSKMLTQDQKALLRTIQTLVGGRNAFGDMQKTIESTQNQIRVFQGSIKNLKLAFGDLLLSEPFQKILTYVNGFIIGITKIIRVFVPFNKSVSFANQQKQLSGFNKEVEKLNKGIGLLSFDKFEALSKSTNKPAENLDITKALSNELKKQQEYYDGIISSVGEIATKAGEIGDKIKEWFLQKFPNLESLKKSLKNIFSLVTAVFGTIMISKISKWGFSTYLAISKVSKSISILSVRSVALTTAGLFGLIFSITKLATSWKDLDKIQRAFYIGLSLVSAGIILFANKAILKSGVVAITKMSSSILSFSKTLRTTFVKALIVARTELNLMSTAQKVASASASAFGIALGVGVFFLLDKLSNNSKIWVGSILAIAGAVTALAVSVMALQGSLTMGVAIPIILTSVAVGVAGLTQAIRGAKAEYFAEGGIIDTKGGNALAVVNEYGKDELVYSNSAGQVEVSNQRSLENSFANAMYRVLPDLLDDYCKSNSIEIIDKTEDGIKIRKNARKYHDEMKRVGLL